MSDNKVNFLGGKELIFSILDLPIILWVMLPNILTTVSAYAIPIFILKTQVLCSIVSHKKIYPPDVFTPSLSTSHCAFILMNNLT